MAKKSLYKIYSGDYTEEGYSQGIDDGKTSQGWAIFSAHPHD